MYMKHPGPRESEHFLEIFKIQVDDIILPWVADGGSYVFELKSGVKG